MASDKVIDAFPWMNRDYFKSILSQIEGHNRFQLLEFIIGSGTNKGESFASSIYRVKLNYLLKNEEQKQAVIILKTSPQSSALSDLLVEIGTFQKEVFVYQEILSRCEKLCADAKIPNSRFAPSLVHADSNALILEDLTRFGFKLANRKERFDLPKSKVVLEKLALYHACSAKLHETEPSLMDKHLNSGIGGEEETPLTYFFSVSMEETMKTIREIPELKKYVSRLETFKIVERERNVFRRSQNEKFNVLCHGDMWINNIFFKNDVNNEPVEALLVDFQECYFGSPGIDLNHFVATSCNRDIHENHIDELIKFYYEHLFKNLHKMQFKKIPSYADIKEEFNRKADQGLVVLLSIVPVMMIENGEHANPDNFIADKEGADEIRREVFGNPKFVEVLKFLLPKMAEKI